MATRGFYSEAADLSPSLCRRMQQMLNQLLEVIFRKHVASEVHAQMARDPTRQGAAPVALAEDWNEFIVISRDQSLCRHQILFVADTPFSCISPLFVIGSANQQHEVATTYRGFHEMCKTIAKFGIPLIDENFESVRFEPEG